MIKEDYELTLFDRLNTIRSVIAKYGEENFYISFSGGKDSTVLHYLLDKAIPNNTIPRVFIDTGIEYLAIRKFVLEMAENDKRFVIVKPSQPIKQMLETFGYPFKSKQHSHNVAVYQHSHTIGKALNVYINGALTSNGKQSLFHCPKILKYQFTEEFKLKCSDLCCMKLKKQPAKKWEKENNKTMVLTGMRKEEGGNRLQLTCIITDKNGNLKKFHPLAVVSNEWEEWFIQTNNIQLCELYYPPFNFQRTGCVGCPFTLKLQEQLDTIKQHLPMEYKRCEIIWKPVYDEYRRIGYRLRKESSIDGKEEL